MSAEVDEFVDTSDLDLLDDERRHAFCAICQGLPVLGVPFIAWCGARAVNLHPRNWPEDAIPPNACEDCVAADTGVCGHRRFGPAH